MTTNGNFVNDLLDDSQAETLRGDLRDTLLSHVRALKKPWPQMSEQEQSSVICSIDELAKHLIRGTARLIAARQFANLSVHLCKWTVKDDLKIELSASGNTENILALAQHGNGGMLVLADAADYFGERAPAKPEPDQLALPEADQQPAAAH